MKTLLFLTLLLSASVLLAQDNSTANQKESKDQVTVSGCVSQSNGDYVLIKTNPAITYELRASGKTRLHHYMGQRVEVTGEQEPTLSSSSDAMAKEGSAAPITLHVSSIKTIDKDCSEANVNR